jgi:hypothetical protein
MIDVARILAERLRQVEWVHGRLLCLGYAEHVLGECRDALPEALRELSASYLTAAWDLLDGDGTMSALADLHRSYFTARLGGSRQAEEITWVAVLGVSACWQRELKAEGLVHSQLVDVTLLVVSEEGQRVAGRYHGSPWSEARWQLVHWLGTAPSTVDLRPLSHLFTAVDEQHSRALVLDYTEHVLRECHDALSAADLEHALAYLQAARDLLAGAGTAARLAEARDIYQSTKGDSMRTTWLVPRAVNVVLDQSTPDLSSAARHAQSVILAHSRRDMRKAETARWNEERWQLVRLVEGIGES